MFTDKQILALTVMAAGHPANSLVDFYQAGDRQGKAPRTRPLRLLVSLLDRAHILLV
jgi:hypothetical protein